MLLDSEYKRICWASRRGMLELDLILVPFVENCFRDLHESDQKRFVTMLEGEDADMFAWFLGHQKPSDPGMKIIVERILTYTKDAANSH